MAMSSICLCSHLACALTSQWLEGVSASQPAAVISRVHKLRELGVESLLLALSASERQGDVGERARTALDQFEAADRAGLALGAAGPMTTD